MSNSSSLKTQSLFESSKEFRVSRLESLFSDFEHLKETNPEGHQANLNIWKQFLRTYFNSNDMLYVDSNHMMKDLTYHTTSKTYTPKSLNIVLDSMINQDHTLVPLSVFTTYPLEAFITGNKSILTSFIKLIWNVNHFNGLVNYESKGKRESYMLLEKLYKYSNKVQDLMLPKINDPMHEAHLFEVVRKSSEMTKQEFDICIIYLSRDLKILKKEDDLIYLVSGDENKMATENDKSPNIKELKNLADLNYAIYKLNEYSQLKQDEITKWDKDVKKSIRLGQTNVAKSKLKIKKLFESQLLKSLSSLENIHMVKVKIEDAQNNLLIMGTLEVNSKLLKSLNDKISVEDIDNAMDHVFDEIEKSDEISGKLENLLNKNQDIDDELGRLAEEMKEDKEKVKEKVKENNDTETNELVERFKYLNVPNENLHDREAGEEDHEIERVMEPCK